MYFLHFPYTLHGKTYVFPTLSLYITWKNLCISYTFPIHYLGKLVYFLYFPYTLPGGSLCNSNGFLMHCLGKIMYLLHLSSTLPLRIKWENLCISFAFPVWCPCVSCASPDI